MKAVKPAQAGEARLGDLGSADRIIGRGRLSAALRIEARIALAEADKVGFHPVGDAEVEVSPVRDLEKAGGSQILVVGLALDIGPEFAGGLRHIRFTDQIFATLDQRRSEAEVKAEQGRFLPRAFEQPVEDLLSRPAMARAD